MLTGDRGVKIGPMNGRQVPLRRGNNCAMTIPVDGQRIRGTYEESIGCLNPPSLTPLSSIDDVATEVSIAPNYRTHEGEPASAPPRAVSY